MIASNFQPKRTTIFDHVGEDIRIANIFHMLYIKYGDISLVHLYSVTNKDDDLTTKTSEGPENENECS